MGLNGNWEIKAVDTNIVHVVSTSSAGTIPASGEMRLTSDGRLRIVLELDASRAILRAILARQASEAFQSMLDTLSTVIVDLVGKAVTGVALGKGTQPTQ